jgi:hypothetical protein
MANIVKFVSILLLLVSLGACKSVQEEAALKCETLFRGIPESLATCKRGTTIAEQKFQEVTITTCLGFVKCVDPMRAGNALWAAQDYCDAEYYGNPKQRDVCRKSVEGYMLARMYSEGVNTGMASKSVN